MVGYSRVLHLQWCTRLCRLGKKLRPLACAEHTITPLSAKERRNLDEDILLPKGNHPLPAISESLATPNILRRWKCSLVLEDPDLHLFAHESAAPWRWPFSPFYLFLLFLYVAFV